MKLFPNKEEKERNFHPLNIPPSNISKSIEVYSSKTLSIYFFTSSSLSLASLKGKQSVLMVLYPHKKHLICLKRPK